MVDREVAHVIIQLQFGLLWTYYVAYGMRMNCSESSLN